jgi:hypothetical protein
MTLFDLNFISHANTNILLVSTEGAVCKQNFRQFNF